MITLEQLKRDQREAFRYQRRLKKKGKDSLPMSRFRPNIVISNTTKAFDEDNWKDPYPSDPWHCP